MKLEDIEITDEMMESFGNHLKEEEMRKKRNENRIRKYLSRLSDVQIEKSINHFFKWEESFEENQYKNGVQTTSLLFQSFLDYCSYHGEVLEIDDEDFLSSAYKWNEYTFKTYCGQGCFNRIIKNNKIIFQTT